MDDRFEVTFKDHQYTSTQGRKWWFTQGRQWWFGQAPIDNADTPYMREMLGRMSDDGAQWFVKFCRFVCTAVDEVKGENDD